MNGVGTVAGALVDEIDAAYSKLFDVKQLCFSTLAHPVLFDALFVLFRGYWPTRSEEKAQRNPAHQQPRNVGARSRIGYAKRVLWGIDKVSEQERRDNAAQHASRYSKACRDGDDNGQANDR
jgi:hypothetical protein